MAKRQGQRSVVGQLLIAGQVGRLPGDVLQSIPITMPGALRDATSALQPARQSRLARVLRTLSNKDERATIATIIKNANDALEANPFIKSVQPRIHNQSDDAIGSALSQGSLIRASEPNFERIAQTPRLVIDKNRTTPREARSPMLHRRTQVQRLWYNNLLYIATVMTELHTAQSATMPLLLVEEPGAHLHTASDKTGQPHANNRTLTT